MRNNRNVSVIVLGCAKNQVEMESMSAKLAGRGWNLTPDVQGAFATVVHTCGFLKAGREEAESFISEVRKKSPGGFIIMTGCFSQYLKDKKPKGVDLMLGTGELHTLPEVLEGLAGGRDIEPCRLPASGYHDAASPRPIHPGQLSAYLRIAEGCAHRCSFCLIPQLRGNHKSRPERDILKEACSLTDRGIKELVLISQDTTYYGKDLSPRSTLAGLARKILKETDAEWLRILYAYPSEVDKDLISLLADEPRLCRYLDMPLQHLSDKILGGMGREWKREKTLQLLDDLKTKVPDLALRTTFITGFPGETEKEFSQLLRKVEEGIFEHVGVFAYSDEPRTLSAGLKGKVPEKIAQERCKELLSAQSKVIAKRSRGRLGRTIDVLVERNPEGNFEARASFQAPEVDGNVLLDHSPKSAGIFRAKVTGSSGIHIKASLLAD